MELKVGVWNQEFPYGSQFCPYILLVTLEFSSFSSNRVRMSLGCHQNSPSLPHLNIHCINCILHYYPSLRLFPIYHDLKKMERKKILNFLTLIFIHFFNHFLGPKNYKPILCSKKKCTQTIILIFSLLMPRYTVLCEQRTFGY